TASTCPAGGSDAGCSARARPSACRTGVASRSLFRDGACQGPGQGTGPGGARRTQDHVGTGQGRAAVREPRGRDGQHARSVTPGGVTKATTGRRVRLTTVAAGVAVSALTVASLLAASTWTPAWAQDISINFGQGGGLTERVLQLVALMTV